MCGGINVIRIDINISRAVFVIYDEVPVEKSTVQYAQELFEV